MAVGTCKGASRQHSDCRSDGASVLFFPARVSNDVVAAGCNYDVCCFNSAFQNCVGVYHAAVL